MAVVMIIILIIIFSIGIIQMNIKRNIKKIEELEHRLDKYYKEREQTQKLRLKDKGLIK